MKKRITESFLNSIDVSTRGNRRKAMAFVIELLEKIRNAEEQYMEKIPSNLQSGDSYCDAECCVEAIIDVIDSLSDTY